MLRKLVTLGFTTEKVLSSSFKRAKQKAEIALKVGLASRIEIKNALASRGDSLSLIDNLKGRYCLIDHDPDLSNLAFLLIGAPKGCLELNKSGCAHLRLNNEAQDPLDKAKLMALIKPSLILDH